MKIIAVFFNLLLDVTLQNDSESFIARNSEEIWSLVILAILVLAVIHMFITFRFRRFKIITKEDIKNMRIDRSMPENASEQENELAMDYLEEMFNHWTLVSSPKEEELKAPTRKIHLDKSREQLDKVKVLLPTDEYVIYRMNELGNVLNSNAKRVFSGSKLLMIVSMILGVILFFNAKNEFNSTLGVILNLWWLWASIIFYFFASFSPQFLVDKRWRRLENINYSNAVVAFFVGLFVGAPTFNFISSRTRGTTSIGLIGFIFSIVIVGIMASFILIFGLINYIRNFIVYF